MTEMGVAFSRLRNVALILSLALTMSAVPAFPLGQSSGKQPRRGRKSGAVARAPIKRYVVEGPLSLKLLQCRGELEISAIGFVGDSLEISGSTVTLTSGNGARHDGTVFAYSRSAYYIDSNISLSFAQTKVPISSAEWRPPLTVSLLLSQSRKNHREVILSPVRGALTSSAAARLLCAEATAAAK